MQESDRERFFTLLAGIAEVAGESLSDARIEGYFRILREYEIEQIAAAADRHMRLSKFFPKPAELIELIDGSPDDQAERAWTLLVDLVERHGVTDSVATDDPAFVQAINEAFGGWIRAGEVLHDASEPMLASYAKQFKACYRLALKQLRPDMPLYLVGSYEANNRQSCGQWGARLGDGGFQLRVAIVAGGKLTDRQVMFSARTGMLTDESRALLAPANLQRLALEAARPAPLALKPAAEPDPSTVEHGEELLAEWQKRFNPDGRLSLNQVVQMGLAEKLPQGWEDPPAVKEARRLKAAEVGGEAA